MKGDDKLIVEFKRVAVKDNFNSEKEGRPVFIEEDQITIVIPGDKLVSIVRPVEPSDKDRWPTQWAAYVNGQTQSVAGTPVESWLALTPAQAATLSANGFRTVEQIVAASDAQLKSLGMGLGASPSTMRQKAAEFIGTDSPDVAELKARIAALEAGLKAGTELAETKPKRMKGLGNVDEEAA